MSRFLAVFGILLAICLSPARGADQQVIRACGAVSVALPVNEAVKTLRQERDLEVVMGAVGGTLIGLESLGSRKVDIAFSSRALTPVDRAKFPEILFNEIPIGAQVVALAVSRDVWESGVHSLTPGQVRAIYEGRVKNWKELGGPDIKITIFMSAQGRGQWEIFVQWLYDEIRKAPVWKGSTVKEDREARNMIEFTRGSLALLPLGMTDNRNTFALALGEVEHPVAPALENVINETYPLSRPLILVVNDKPTGGVKIVADFMVGDRGQAIVKQMGYITLAELEAARGPK